MSKEPLIILTGPTSVGKTGLSIKLAQKIGGEIISADSVQVYKHMDIGSAKIKQAEMQGIPHHMIDVLEPTESFNIMLFQQYTKKYIKEIRERGHIPILVGGTGFYIQSILYDIDFTKEEDDGSYRKQLELLAEEKGEDFLYDMLKEIDSESAESIHKNNLKRVIRALEYYHLTGQKISEHNAIQHEKESVYQECYFVLNDERERIYERIDRRVDQMLEEGLVEEVKNLLAQGCKRQMVSMQALGYKEIIDYLNGDITLDRAVYFIKRDTRHFAKRQLTWFRREKNVIWVDKSSFSYDEDAIIAHMLEKMKEKGIHIPL